MQSYQRFQHIVHTVFNTSGTNALRSLSRAKVGYTLGFAQRIVHKGTHGETRGVSDGGWYHYPRSVPHVSETLRGRGLKRQTLPLLGLGRGCSQRTQRAFGTAMRLCASLSRGVAAPLGCAALTVEFLAFLLLLKTTIANSLTPWYYGVTKSEAIG